MNEVTQAENQMNDNQTSPVHESVRDEGPVQESVQEDKPLTTAELAGAPTHSASKSNGAKDEAQTATPLLGQDESADFKRRWDAIQASFVDEPRRAVEEADNLVATAMKRLAEVFASERDNLEGQWDRGDDVSTEDLRVALRRYRSFFGRLLAV
jgi:molecular chaperone GrpE (heat shock protein)